MMQDFRFFISEKALNKLTDPKFTGEGKVMNLFAFPVNSKFEDELRRGEDLMKEIEVSLRTHKTPSLFESQEKKPLGTDCGAV